MTCLEFLKVFPNLFLGIIRKTKANRQTGAAIPMRIKEKETRPARLISQVM